MKINSINLLNSYKYQYSNKNNGKTNVNFTSQNQNVSNNPGNLFTSHAMLNIGNNKIHFGAANVSKEQEEYKKNLAELNQRNKEIKDLIEKRIKMLKSHPSFRTSSDAELIQIAGLDDSAFEQIIKLAETRNDVPMDELYKYAKSKHINQYFYIKERKKQFSAVELDLISKLHNDSYQIAKQFFYVEERGDFQFDAQGAISLSKLNDKELERARQLFFVPERKEQQFSGNEICSLVKLTTKQMEKARQLFYIEQRGARQFSASFICKIVQLTDEQFKKAKQLSECRVRGVSAFEAEDICAISELDDNQFENAKQIIYIPTKGEKQLPSCDIIKLSKLNGEQFEKAKECMNLSPDTPADVIVEVSKLNGEQFEKAKECMNLSPDTPADVIVEVSKLNGEQFEKAKECMNLSPDTPADVIVEVSKLNGEQFEKAKECIKIGYNPNITPDDILEFSSYDGRKFEKLLQVLYVEGRGKNQFSKSEIDKMMELEDNDFEDIKKYLYIKGRGRNQFTSETILNFLNVKPRDMFNILPYLVYNEERSEEEQLSEKEILFLMNIAYGEFYNRGDFHRPSGLIKSNFTIVARILDDNILGIKGRKGNQLSALEACMVAEQPENRYEFSKKHLLYLPNRTLKEQFNGQEICDLAMLIRFNMTGPLIQMLQNEKFAKLHMTGADIFNYLAANPIIKDYFNALFYPEFASIEEKEGINKMFCWAMDRQYLDHNRLSGTMPSVQRLILCYRLYIAYLEEMERRKK